jgi:mitochondrial cardiolipin hydrolase
MSHPLLPSYPSHTTHTHTHTAIVDNSAVVNGSFNWTRSAVLNNRENIVITNNARVVQRFAEQFATLWQLYNPANLRNYTVVI